MWNSIDHGHMKGTTTSPSKGGSSALAGVAQWIECPPANQRVTGSIPSQDTSQSGSIQARSPLGGAQEAMTHCCFSLSPSLPLPVKTNKYNLKKIKRGYLKRGYLKQEKEHLHPKNVVVCTWWVQESTFVEYACGKPVGYLQQVQLPIKPTESTTAICQQKTRRILDKVRVLLPFGDQANVFPPWLPSRDLSSVPSRPRNLHGSLVRAF